MKYLLILSLLLFGCGEDTPTTSGTSTNNPVYGLWKTDGQVFVDDPGEGLELSLDFKTNQTFTDTAKFYQDNVLGDVEYGAGTFVVTTDSIFMSRKEWETGNGDGVVSRPYAQAYLINGNVLRILEGSFSIFLTKITDY